MSDQIALLEKYFSLSENQMEQFSRMGELYRSWNENINVISRKDIDSLYERHILHSLGIAKILQFVSGSKVLDVGTGGGFPGIPLAVFFPEVQFHLVDSIGKKIKVVQGIAESLGLQNVVAEQKRAEKVKGKYDFVVSRAVTRMKPFTYWVKDKFLKDQHNERRNGILYLKGGDLEEELAEINQPWLDFELKHYFEEPFFETKKVIYVAMS